MKLKLLYLGIILFVIGCAEAQGLFFMGALIGTVKVFQHYDHKYLENMPATSASSSIKPAEKPKTLQGVK